MSLVNISKKFKTDKFQHGFADFYNKILFNYKNNIKSIFEIGILKGSSLLSWNEYFPYARIYGIDKNNIDMKNNNIKTFVCHQNDEKLLNNIIKETGNFDIIIDDGSHDLDHQQISLGILFKNVNPQGFYIIEDLHTSTNFYTNASNYKRKEDKSNSTLRMIFNYIETKKIKSEYLDNTACEYIENNIKQCYLYHHNNGSKCSITVILQKK
tara:strand:+ start:1911 stop:2543 length:633 start_codon:yes stop_codon:yes gene_type:complete